MNPVYRKAVRPRRFRRSDIVVCTIVQELEPRALLGSTNGTGGGGTGLGTSVTLLADSGGVYDGLPYPATATVNVSSGGGGSYSYSEAGGVSPIVTYYSGNSPSGSGTTVAPSAVGTYTAVGTYPGSQYFYPSTSAPVTFTITPAVPTVSVTDATGTYNNLAFAAAATVTGVNGAASTLEGVAPTLTYYVGTASTGSGTSDAPTTVGTYTVVGTFPGSADYGPATSSPVTFTIRAATPLLSVAAYGGTFNGTAFPASVTLTNATGLVASSLEGIVPTVTYYSAFATAGTGSSVAPTAVGNYSVFVSFPGSENYGSVSSSQFFTIFGAGGLVTPSVSVVAAGGIFNGTAYAATATVTGVSGPATATLQGVAPTLTYYIGSAATGNGATTAPTAAGSYTVVASFPGSANYGPASSSPVSFVIGLATPMVSVADADGIYTGNAFRASAMVTGVGGATVSGATILTYFSGTSVSETGSTTSPTNSGTYTVVAAFASSDSNYSKASSAPLTFQITAETPAVMVTAVGGTYTGNAFPATASVTGVSGGTVSGTTTFAYYSGSNGNGTGSTTPPTSVGTYTVVAVFTSSDTNFSNASSAPVTFSITPPNVFVTDASGAYTGNPFQATANVTGVGGATVSGTTTFTYYDGYFTGSASGTGSTTAPTNAGTYTVVAAFTSSTSNNTSSTLVTLSDPFSFTILPARSNPVVIDAGGI